MALALLGPNHRGNVTFETINNDENAEDSFSMKGASRRTSTDLQIAHATSVKFAEPDEVKFSEWYEHTTSAAQNGQKSSAEKDGMRTPEMGSSLRYV